MGLYHPTLKSHGQGKKHVPHRLFNRRFLDIQSLGIFWIKRKAGFDTNVGDDHQYLCMKPPIHIAMIYHEYRHSKTRSFDFSKTCLLCFLDIVLPVSLVPLFVSPLVFSWPLPFLFFSRFIIGDAVCLLAPPMLVNVMWSQMKAMWTVQRSTARQYGAVGVWCLVVQEVSGELAQKKYVHINGYWEHHPNDVRSDCRGVSA